jgi:hypothetical protein
MARLQLNGREVDEVPDEELPKSHTLKSIPPEIYRIIQREQADIKINRRSNTFSFECTIYKMLRDYDRCRKETKTFKPEPV